ncbi:MAG: hypothetical protein JSV36_13240 [Anaerolineae bacterium]|nr:MAG: hypothetical protein JSV36_13240 [Anaerolineae bacterium]
MPPCCVPSGLYWLAYQRVRQDDVPPSLATILLITVLFSLPLLFSFPFNATDVYHYFIQGRISTVYHQSPLFAPPDASLPNQNEGETPLSHPR